MLPEIRAPALLESMGTTYCPFDHRPGILIGDRYVLPFWALANFLFHSWEYGSQMIMTETLLAQGGNEFDYHGQVPVVENVIRSKCSISCLKFICARTPVDTSPVLAEVLYDSLILTILRRFDTPLSGDSGPACSWNRLSLALACRSCDWACPLQILTKPMVPCSSDVCMLDVFHRYGPADRSDP